MASRAVDSQQMFVAQPVMISVSMPREVSNAWASEVSLMNAPNRYLLIRRSLSSVSIDGCSAWPGLPSAKVAYIPARFSGVQNASNQFEQVDLLSSSMVF
jgi:hypothetical protein